MKLGELKFNENTGGRKEASITKVVSYFSMSKNDIFFFFWKVSIITCFFLKVSKNDIQLGVKHVNGIHLRVNHMCLSFKKKSHVFYTQLFLSGAKDVELHYYESQCSPMCGLRIV